MDKAYLVFQIICDDAQAVQAGVLVEKYQLSNGVVIPVVRVGESGRGRKEGIVAVAPTLASSRELWEQGRAFKLLAARIGQTRTGRPKLIEAAPEEADRSAYIAVFRTPIGFRGSNAHTSDTWGGREPGPFPGQILEKGIIAQGAAGRAGSGEQLIALVPANTIVRIRLSGRLYGRPSEYFCFFPPDRDPFVLTHEERTLAEDAGVL